MRGARAANTQLGWRDREGRLIENLGPPSANWELDRSHDGTRLAISGGTDAGDIWILELERGMRTRFTFHTADDRSPVWSPDDKLVAFASAHENEGEIWVRPANGQTDARLLYTAGTQAELSHWSPDGRLILFDHLGRGEDALDVWALEVDSGEAKPLAAGPFDQWGGALSPDGRYLAYTSDESGEYQIYVQSFPEATGRWMISNDDLGGMAFRPTWSDDGRELLYIRRVTLVSVPIGRGETFSFGAPKKLFTVNVTNANADFDVSVDGQRILTNELPAADRDLIGARLIQNWAAKMTP
jgi:Tol biopolymer transport system component